MIIWDAFTISVLLVQNVMFISMCYFYNDIPRDVAWWLSHIFLTHAGDKFGLCLCNSLLCWGRKSLRIILKVFFITVVETMLLCLLAANAFLKLDHILSFFNFIVRCRVHIPSLSAVVHLLKVTLTVTSHCDRQSEPIHSPGTQAVDPEWVFFPVGCNW